MRDAQRRKRLADAEVDLDFVRGRAEQAVRNLDGWTGLGYPGSSQMVSDVHQARGVHDPVGELAGRRLDATSIDEVERMTRARAAIDEDIEAVGLALARLRKTVTAYTSTVSTSKARPECELCGEEGRSSVVYAEGRCRWHYDFRADWGIDAGGELTRLHLASRRISRSKVLECHPELRSVGSA